MEVIGNEITDTDIRILKESACPSLSGKSTLTYHIGATAEAEILLRIDANSGTGKFNRQWVKLNKILELIDDKPFSWSVLSPVFKNQSVNTAGFMIAVLMNEGLATALERKYAKVAPSAFMAGVKKLVKPKKARKTPQMEA